MKAFSIPVLILFFCYALTSVSSAQGLSVSKDFEKDWMVFQNGGYKPFLEKKGKVTSIYFFVETNKYPDSAWLRISSPKPIALFLNGQLVKKSNSTINLNVDSLRRTLQSTLLQVMIYQDVIHEGGLKTTLLSRTEEMSASMQFVPSPFFYFRDFAIVGMLFLMVMLIVIIQLNPKLAADYFSVTKIFSMREGEDSQAYSRITSSINILFYAYSSLMLGYYLMIVFHFLSSHYTVALAFEANTFWEAIVKWLELSLLVLGLFFLKIVLINGLSFIFGMSEIGGIHFFNWVRLLLGVFGVLTIVLFLYFITHGYREGFYDFLLGMVSWVLVGWTILIILKLYRQMDHSIFHLFSYICATELIPFLITIKVLYY
jgi:predicted cupin superfamily sugar epimerase